MQLCYQVLTHWQSWARTKKMQLSHLVVCLHSYLHTEFRTHLTTCAPKKSRYLRTKKVHKCAIPSFAHWQFHHESQVCKVVRLHHLTVITSQLTTHSLSLII